MLMPGIWIWKWHFFFFCSAVFRDNSRYCYSHCPIVVHCRCAKLWHFVISLILLKIFTENLRVCVHYLKSNPYYQVDNSEWIFFRVMPVFRLKTFYSLSSTPQLSVGTRMQCFCFNYILKHKQAVQCFYNPDVQGLWKYCKKRRKY